MCGSGSGCSRRQIFDRYIAMADGCFRILLLRCHVGIFGRRSQEARSVVLVAQLMHRRDQAHNSCVISSLSRRPVCNAMPNVSHYGIINLHNDTLMRMSCVKIPTRGRPTFLPGGSNPDSQRSCRKGPVLFTVTWLLRPCDSSKITRTSALASCYVIGSNITEQFLKST